MSAFSSKPVSNVSTMKSTGEIVDPRLRRTFRIVNYFFRGRWYLRNEMENYVKSAERNRECLPGIRGSRLTHTVDLRHANLPWSRNCEARMQKTSPRMLTETRVFLVHVNKHGAKIYSCPTLSVPSSYKLTVHRGKGTQEICYSGARLNFTEICLA